MIKKIKTGLTTSGRIFILPTKLGLYFLAITFVLFLFSLSYGNPLAYTATFLFSSVIVTSTIFTNYNLSGVTAKMIKENSTFYEDENKLIQLVIINSSNKTRFDIEAQLGKNKTIDSHSVGASDNKKTILSISNLDRGQYQINRVKVMTSFPFGIFYSWRYIHVDHDVFIFPKAIGEEQPIELTGLRESSEGLLTVGGNEDFYQHNPYIPGESWKRINWKVWAKSEDLLIKQYESSVDYAYSFDFSKLSHLSEQQALRQMSKWIKTAKENHSAFKLTIGGESSFGSGNEFCDIGLKKLAVYKKDIASL